MNLLQGFALSLLVVAADTSDGCSHPESSDRRQSRQQERILQEGTSAVGLPNIRNFREKRLLKDILELRDQMTLVTYTYVQTLSGKFRFFCNSIGYAIPYSTQYTSPSKLEDSNCSTCAWHVMPQADPNGLFSPSSAEGTWVMCKDPGSDAVKPVYVEPKVVVQPFPMAPDLLEKPNS